MTPPQISIRLRPDVLHRIEAFRRELSPIPSRSEAIAQLTELGFEAWAELKRQDMETAEPAHGDK